MFGLIGRLRPSRSFTAVLAAALAFAAAGRAGAGEFAHPIPENTPVIASYSFRINYSVASTPGNRPVRVEFFMTEDMGATWRKYGEDDDLQSPMNVRVDRDGVYGFVSVATDSRGNREREPGKGTRPESVVVVDRKPPTARWLAPAEAVLLQPEMVEFEWVAEDENLGPGPVTLEASSDNGHAWTPIVSEQPAAGKFAWRPSGESGSIRFRLLARDRAGNTFILPCPAAVTLDNTPPTVRLVGPEASGALDVNIEYTAQDEPGGTGLRDVTLYASYDDGRSWRKSAVSPSPGAPIPFTAERPGRIALAAVARDGAYNFSPLPYSRMPIPFYLLVDTDPPHVAISDDFLRGRGELTAGTSHTISWTAAPSRLEPGNASLPLDPRCASIYLSVDGGATWGSPVADHQPPSGNYSLRLPDQSHEAVRLKVEVVNRFGRRGAGESPVFSVEKPRTLIRDITPGPRPGEQPALIPSSMDGAAPPPFNPTGLEENIIPGPGERPISIPPPMDAGPPPFSPPGVDDPPMFIPSDGGVPPLFGGSSAFPPTVAPLDGGASPTGAAPDNTLDPPPAAAEDEGVARIFPHRMVEELLGDASRPGAAPASRQANTGRSWDEVIGGSTSPVSPAPTDLFPAAPSPSPSPSLSPSPSFPPLPMPATFSPDPAATAPGMALPGMPSLPSAPGMPDLFSNAATAPSPQPLPDFSSAPPPPTLPLPGTPASPSPPAPAPAAPSSGGAISSIYVPPPPTAPSASTTAPAAPSVSGRRLEDLEKLAADPLEAGNAGQELRRLAAEQPGNHDIRLALATAYMTAREYALAAREAETAVTLNPGYWYAHLLCGHIYFNHATALQKQATQAMADGFDASNETREMDLLIGRAKAELQEAMKLNPDSKHVYLRFGDVIYLEGQARRARLEQMLLRQSKDQSKEAQDRAKDEALRQTQPIYTEAAKYYRRAYDMPPLGYHEAYSLGRIAYYLEQYDDALAYLRTALENPFNTQGEPIKPSEAYHVMGSVYALMSQYQEAIRAWSRARELYPPDDPSVALIDELILTVREEMNR